MSTHANEFVLYSYFRSSASFRVRIAMNLKGLPYEYKAVHLLNEGGEQFKEDYRELNPSRQVPTLIHQGRAIGQSMAIIDYLDRVKPEPALFPADAFQRALVMQACEIVNSGVQPIHNLKVLQELERSFGADTEDKNEWASLWIEEGCHALEKFLAPRSGRFAFGDTVSAADCFIVPHLANVKRFNVNMAPFPTLARIGENCLALEAFRKAAPDVQPDTPPTA